MAIEVKIELNDVQATIDKLGAGISNRRPLMQSIAGTMLAAVQQNFEQGGRPMPWLAPKYRNGAPLMDNGILKNSITDASDNDHAIVGTNLIYAAIHNFGGQIKRKSGHITNMPKREFMILSAQDKADIFEDVQSYFQQLIK